VSKAVIPCDFLAVAARVQFLGVHMTTASLLESLPNIGCAGPEKPVSPERQERRAAMVLTNTTLLQRALRASEKRTAQDKRDAETYRRRHHVP
jgi:hypothetical protein